MKLLVDKRGQIVDFLYKNSFIVKGGSRRFRFKSIQDFSDFKEETGFLLSEIPGIKNLAIRDIINKNPIAIKPCNNI